MKKGINFKIKALTVALSAAVMLIIGILSAFGNVPHSLNALFADSADITEQTAYVEMFDVGQGDSILIVSGDKSALIDTGIKSYSDNIYNKLRDKGIKKLDFLLITHNHSDHMGGIVELTNDTRVKNLILPDLKKTDEKTDKLQSAIENVKSKGGKYYIASQGMVFNIGDFEMTVLGCYYDEQDENDRSIITMAKIGKWKFLFTGDAGESAEKRLMAEHINIDCDVLKLGHHGSMYSSSEEFIEACSPSLAMISCGMGNRYSHPHDVVLLRLQEAGIKFWRTDLNGDITFNITEKDIEVSTEK